MSMTVARALTIRAAFVKIKQKLADAGMDVSGITSVTQLPAALSNALPEDMLQQAAQLLTQPEMLETLLNTFTGLAEKGGIPLMFGAEPSGLWASAQRTEMVEENNA